MSWDPFFLTGINVDATLYSIFLGGRISQGSQNCLFFFGGGIKLDANVMYGHFEGFPLE